MHLVLVTPGAVPVHLDGRVQVTDKFTSGVALFQQHWPGDLTVLARRDVGGIDDQNVRSLWWDREDLGFDLVLTDDEASTLDTLRPDVVMSPLKVKTTALSAHFDRMVVVAENPVAERMRYAWCERTTRRPPSRQWAGALRQERVLRALTRATAGVQCNGFPAWNAYSGISRLPSLIFDNRVPAETIARAGARVRAPGPLRMGFSGQLMHHKGPEYAVRLANRLESLGVAASLTILGTGPLEGELRSMARGNVEFLGALPFDPDWMDYVRSNIDVMVLPHVQGDPSGTYLECAGLGVPILGFANTALQGLVVEAQLGWTVKMRDEHALLAQARALAADPTLLAERGAAGQAFMREHSMEREFAARAEHLLAAARNRRRLPGSAPA